MPDSTIAPLHRLARAYGVSVEFFDGFGKKRIPPPESLLAILRSLGAPVSGLDDVADALSVRRLSRWQQMLEPVNVAWQGEPSRIVARLPGRLASAAIELEIQLEDGATERLRVESSDIGAQHSVEALGETFHSLSLPLPDHLPAGYHLLELKIGKESAYSKLFVAPQQVYAPQSQDSHSHWGVFLPLYALESNRSWGVGDFTDLNHLIEWVHGLGGNLVGTLPMLATYLDQPCDPSPYTPVSRLFWNELFVDPTSAPEWQRSIAARDRFASPELQHELEQLRAGRQVDYRRAMALKRQVLEQMLSTLLAIPTGRRNEFFDFVQGNPRVVSYARFRATVEKRGVTWHQWPDRLKSGRLTSYDFDDKARLYHLYAQWLAHGQLKAVSEKSKQRAPGLYLDLPLGVHPGGFDVWDDPDSFALGVSGGAPPDSFFTKGQDWGFAPIQPEEARRSGHALFIECIRRHLDYAGVLRIDHVMGLHRLYWAPSGFSAEQGSYIRYPAEELYAILAIESQRRKALIVGEDLGTVPSYIRRGMGRHGLQRTYVAQFEFRADPEAAISGPAAESVATLNTHDMAPFAAYWDGLDIDDQLNLGLISEESAPKERQAREAIKSALKTYFSNRRAFGDGEPSELAVARGVMDELARSDARAVLVNLEDLWAERHQQNTPGTVDERPNWKRKARFAFDEFRDQPEVAGVLKAIDRARATKQPAAAAEPTPKAMEHTPFLTDFDLHLLAEGSHYRTYTKLGAHLAALEGQNGTRFAVWAPNAERVAVIGDFNDWNPATNPLTNRGDAGVWEGFAPGVGSGDAYKYHIASQHRGYQVEKADPYAFHAEVRPKSASIVWDLDGYDWGDSQWMSERGGRNAHNSPISIYEVHLGSWRRSADADDTFLSYRDLAHQLADYAEEMGYTHVQLMPPTEHPFDGSWGYQTIGYFAPTSRHGTPQDFMYFVDTLHRRGIGVLMDWVPGHFPTDEHGLAYFDGTHLYEHADPRQGFHPDWGTLIFNYGRREVANFLIGNALFWLERYHIDGLRVDAVASMLYLDYARRDGEWVPNQYGGKENIEAIEFLRRFNERVYSEFPDVMTVAEESTSWPMVSRPAYVGGLGFGYKWNMGWMNDMLDYVSQDSVYRRYEHEKITFSMLYAFTENFVLPFSHDEVVHGKGSMLRKMPGDDWQKFANVRTLYGYKYGHPGKKLLFMGGEFGQWDEWNHDKSLDWHLLQFEPHQGLQQWVRDLNSFYRAEPALYEVDFEHEGFEWIDCHDRDASIVSFLRWNKDRDRPVMVISNFTPVPRHNYWVGVPFGGYWREALNSDAEIYGGSNMGNQGGVMAETVSTNDRPYTIQIVVPPLATIFFQPEIE